MISMFSVRHIFAYHSATFFSGVLFMILIKLSFDFSISYLQSGGIISIFILTSTVPGILFNLAFPNFGRKHSYFQWYVISMLLQGLLLIAMAFAYFEKSELSLLLLCLINCMLSLIKPAMGANFRFFPTTIEHCFTDKKKSVSLTIGIAPIVQPFGMTFAAIIIQSLGMNQLLLGIAAIQLLLYPLHRSIKLNVSSQKSKNEADISTMAPWSLWQNGSILLVLVLTFFFYLLYGFFEVSFPAFVGAREAGISIVGNMWLAFSFGSMLGLYLATKFMNFTNINWLWAIVITWGFGTCSLVSIYSSWSLILVMFALGVSFAPYSSICHSFVDERTHGADKFTVFKMWTSVMMAPVPLGVALCGVLNSFYDNEYLLKVGGIGMMVFGLGFMPLIWVVTKSQSHKQYQKQEIG